MEEKSENFVENVPYNRKYTLEYDPTKENENSPLMEFLEVKPFKGFLIQFHITGDYESALCCKLVISAPSPGSQ